MLALLTRSLGKGSLKAIRYIHHTPEGASSGLYPPAENLHLGLMHVNTKTPQGCGGLRESSPAVSAEGRLWIIFGNDDAHPPSKAEAPASEVYRIHCKRGCLVPPAGPLVPGGPGWLAPILPSWSRHEPDRRWAREGERMPATADANLRGLLRSASDPT